MKKIAISLICALVASTTLTSCLPDGEETELTSTVALLSFSINDLKTRHTITLASGKDSTYTTIMASKNIRFTIDQAQGLVYNSDSIAYATDVTRVVTNIGADGYVSYYKGDEKVGYSEEDSIDFTHPVKFTITSYDEKFSRDYLISINVHQVDPRTTSWRQLEQANFPAGLFAAPKALVREAVVYVLGTDGEGRGYTTTTALGDGVQWSAPAEWTGLPAGADAASVQLVGDVFYMVADGALYSSADALAWATVGNAQPVSTLLAVEDDTQTAWAMVDGTIASSTDMSAWQLGQQPKHAIKAGVAAFSEPLRTNANISRTLFVALPEAEADTCAQVWSKLSADTCWVEVEPQGTNIYGCPNLEHLAVIRYAGKMYAFGGKGLGNRKQPIEAFSACYESRDNGVTWRVRDNVLRLPEAFKGRDEAFATVTDGTCVWVMWSTGDVWCGRWNGL